MADHQSVPTNLEHTNQIKIPLQSQLPPPFIPKGSNPNSKHGSSPNEYRTPSLCIQDLSMMSLTKTNSPKHSVTGSPSICPIYNAMPITNHSSLLDLECTREDEKEAHPYEDDGILNVDITDLTHQCPTHKHTNSASSKHVSSNSNSNREKQPHQNEENPNYNHRNQDENDDKMDPDDVDEDECEESQSVHYKNTQYSYSPHQQYKAQSFITIPRGLTQHLIPNAVRERIVNIYEFINKSTAMVYPCDNASHCNATYIIYNFGFHDKQSNEPLYCIAEKVWIRKNHHQYQMREGLFTANDIERFALPCAYVPKSSRYSKGKLLREMETVRHQLARSLSSVVRNTRWNRVRVFNATLIDNKQCKKHYNKQRLTFFITKTEFDALIKRSVCHTPVEKIKLIPIAMFNEQGCEYRVEYVQIVKLRKNIDIGISYYYDGCNECVKVTGIHLNKYCIINQHQLIYPNHPCRCVQDFQSQIDDLRIGNPDEDLNKYKDVRKRKDDVIKKLNAEVIELQTQVEQLRIQVREHKVASVPIAPQSRNQMNEIMRFSQYTSNLMQHRVQNYPYLPTLPAIQIPRRVHTNAHGNVNRITPMAFVLANTPQTISSVSTIGRGVGSYISPAANTNTNTPIVSPNRNQVFRSVSTSGVGNTFPNTIWPARPTQMTVSDRARTSPSPSTTHIRTRNELNYYL